MDMNWSEIFYDFDQWLAWGLIFPVLIWLYAYVHVFNVEAKEGLTLTKGEYAKKIFIECMRFSLGASVTLGVMSLGFAFIPVLFIGVISSLLSYAIALSVYLQRSNKKEIIKRTIVVTICLCAFSFILVLMLASKVDTSQEAWLTEGETLDIGYEISLVLDTIVNSTSVSGHTLYIGRSEQFTASIFDEAFFKVSAGGSAYNIKFMLCDITTSNGSNEAHVLVKSAPFGNEMSDLECPLPSKN